MQRARRAWRAHEPAGTLVNAADPARKATLSTILWMLAHDEQRERIAVGDLLDALGDRALAALLFVLAFPHVLPVTPGTSAVLGAPLIFLAAQLSYKMLNYALSGTAARTCPPRR